ncbi:MAG: pyridoxal-phosphate dependent enzyme [Chloroflexota bacterium]
MAADYTAVSCTKCGSGWLDARYDYEVVAARWAAPLDQSERTPWQRSLWRYSDLLPLREPDPEISMGEGFTPLSRLYQYERIYNHAGIYVKDERNQPTNSFKDRQAALSVTAMRREGVREAVLASTGNAAVAYAAYCARAGIKLWLFLTSLVPPEKMREVALYGAQVVKVSGTYDETKTVAAEFAKRKGIPMDKGARTIPSKESMKTIAFEIAEQLGLQQHPEQPGRWVAPDWYIQAVSGGIGPIGVSKGFEELHQMGLIDKVPKLGIVQAAGCAPMVKAFEADQETAEPVVPKTLIQVLATGDPGFGYTLLYRAIKKHGGKIIAVEDGETFHAMRQLAARAGISVEPATAVAFAGLDKFLRDGVIKPDETVVVNVSGHTLPAESHILGDQYDRYILELEMTTAAGDTVDEHAEGLGAALKTLDEQVTTIVVVDDNANDRRLIRRLLKSYKNYRVYEARDGFEALKVIADRKPDLVVVDLTMPGLDGFALLEKLKADPATATIPAVVVTAKTLTADDRKHLSQYTESIWTKGGFDTRSLVDHVVKTLGHAPLGVIQRRTYNHAHAAGESTSAPPLTHVPDGEHIIVIIEDNPDDRRLARKMLQSDNYGIIEACNGRDGLKAIYNYHPDLIVLDLMLPDVDGFSILETLQKDTKLQDIPVIVVSAKTLSPDEETTLRQNITAIIEKASLDRKRLLGIIKDKLR